MGTLKQPAELSTGWDLQKASDFRGTQTLQQIENFSGP